MTTDEIKYSRPESSLSDVEIKSIRDNIFLHEEDIVIWKETQYLSKNTIKISFKKLKELTSSMKNFYLIVDLSDSKRPDMEYIKILKTGMHEMTERGMLGIYIFFEKNIMFRSIARYVAARIGIPVFSVKKTREEVINDICKRKNQ